MQLGLFPETPIREERYAEYRQKPRQRIAEHSAQVLSDAEILACIIGSSTAEAEQMLAEFGGWFGLLQADYGSLCNFSGVGNAKAAQIKAALELGRRLLLVAHGERIQIKSPSDVAQLLMMEMSHLDQENLRVVCLDTKNRVQKIHTVYVGSLNSAMIRIGEVFKEPLKQNSCAVIIVHNHPSGAPRSA